MNAREIVFHECLAARKQCVLFDHPSRGVIEVRGKDRVQFLHNVLSNDIKSLAPENGTTACLLNAQAKLIANMNVLCFAEFLWLALDYSLKDTLSQALNKLIIMEDTELVDKSDELKLISIHGPKAKELIKTLITPSPSPSPLPLPRGEDKGEGVSEKLPRQLLDHTSITIESTPSIVIRVNMTGDTGYAFLIQKEKTSALAKFIRQKGAALGLTQIGAHAFETLRIEAGISRYGVDFDESHIPLECGLDKSLSFTKGCFPGQEILARLDSRGGVSKKLVGLELKGETAPKKNDPITEGGKTAGHITSGAFAPILKRTVALGYLSKEYWTPGSSVVVETNGVHIPARVAKLPFYTPASD